MNLVDALNSLSAATASLNAASLGEEVAKEAFAQSQANLLAAEEAEENAKNAARTALADVIKAFSDAGIEPGTPSPDAPEPVFASRPPQLDGRISSSPDGSFLSAKFASADKEAIPPKVKALLKLILEMLLQ